jgi:hypothetical protein
MNSRGKLLCPKRRRYPANPIEKAIMGRIRLGENRETAFIVIRTARKKTEKRRRMLR